MRNLVRTSVFLGVLVLMAVQLSAVEFDPKASKTTRKERKADRLYEAMAYQSAVDLYQEVLKKNSDKVRVHIKLAEAYLKLNDSENAEHHFRKYISKAKLSPPEKLRFAQILMGNQKLTEAEVWVLAYQQDIPRSRVADNLLYSIRNHGDYYLDSAHYRVESLSFNTNQVEFAPAYYDKGLVFASSREHGISIKKKYHWDRSKYLDLYKVEISDDGISKPTPFKDLNSKLHEGPVTFFDHDQQAILTRNHYRTTNSKTGDGINTLQLFHARRSDKGTWDEIDPLPFNGPGFSTGHPSLENGVLYFASNKEGGYGGVDLYRVSYSDEEWGRPENLGPQINTEGDEQFPFIHKGVLYFASNAHGGIGGLDIFKAEVHADGTVANIQNLGYPINSPMDDFGLITKNGYQGYFSSHRGGNDDIYSFEILSEIPEDVIVASLKQEDHMEMDQISKLPDSMTEYAFSFDKADMVIMEEEGVERIYLLAGDQIVPVSTEEDGTYVQGIKVADSSDMAKIQETLSQHGVTVGQQFKVNTIHYGFDKSSINQDAAQELDKLAVLMKRYSGLKINLDSHTDSRGSFTYNEALSDRRSQAAKDYLLAAGVEEHRLITTAQGEQALINECNDANPCSEKDHRLNRRTQFSLVISNTLSTL